MAKTPTLAAGEAVEGGHQSGFTLLELLVVFLILALAAGSVLIWNGTQGKQVRLKPAIVQAVGLFREARTSAIRNASQTVVFIDVRKRELLTGGRIVHLPDDVQMFAKGTDAEKQSDAVIGIRFFPNGRSTGGTVSLKRQEESYEIHVNWLTGRVSLAGTS